VPVDVAASGLAVREEGSEVEELRRGGERGQHPEQQQVHLRDVNDVLEHVEDHRVPEHLRPPEVVTDEAQVPAAEAVVRAVVEVGVVGARGVRVVQAVLAPQGGVGEERVEPDGERADELIESGMAGRDGAVHGVVGDDEETRVGPGAERHQRQPEGRMNGPDREAEGDDQGERPGEDDERREREADRDACA